jgi:transcriptional regulator with XRE-family HTH domain
MRPVPESAAPTSASNAAKRTSVGFRMVHLLLSRRGRAETGAVSDSAGIVLVSRPLRVADDRRFRCRATRGTIDPGCLSGDNPSLVEDGRREESVGQRIRRLRLERGLSQRQLAAPGAHFAYISRIEASARVPSDKALSVLARGLGVSPHYLKTGDPIPPAAARELRIADAELEVRLGRDYAKAESVFRDESADVTEPALVARAQAGLGLLAARRGDNGEAVRLLEAATGSEHLPPEARPDLYETLARCYVGDGRTIAAIHLLERCLADAKERAPADAALQARFGTYLAAAHSALGSTDLARRALDEATEAARGKLPPQARTRAWWVEAVNAWNEGNSDTGLMLMRRAIGLLEAGEDTLQLARAHMVAGRMLNLDERHDEAEDHLERAEAMFTLGADPADLGILRAEQAKIAAARDDGAQALALATEAAALLEGDRYYQTNGWHALALAHAAAEQPEEAERYFKLALEGLTEDRQWREAAQVARQWARLLRRLDRTAEAFRLMEEGTVLAARSIGREAIRARDAR